MKFLASAGCIAGVLLVSSSLCPAAAQDFAAAAAPKLPLVVTFVSGKGVDNTACGTQVKPCRTFNFAIGRTSANGEIKALDPADYGPVVITKSISITGVEGAGINSTPSGGTAITVSAAPTDTINISNLILDGTKIATAGIVFNSGSTLAVTHCTVRNFSGAGNSFGIKLLPGSASKVLIANVTVSNNGTGGIAVIGPSVAVTDSVITNNSIGLEIGIGTLRLARTTSTGNGFGVAASVGTVAESAGNNVITDGFSPALVNVGTQ